jgi:hypothetical protein
LVSQTLKVSRDFLDGMCLENQCLSRRSIPPHICIVSRQETDLHILGVVLCGMSATLCWTARCSSAVSTTRRCSPPTSRSLQYFSVPCDVRHALLPSRYSLSLWTSRRGSGRSSRIGRLSRYGRQLHHFCRFLHHHLPGDRSVSCPQLIY